MSPLLAVAMVIATLNVLRILGTGESDPLGLLLNLVVLIVAPILAVATRNTR